ncbi:hypothetical protein ACLKA6_019917 [Drosophila palustris]
MRKWRLQHDKNDLTAHLFRNLMKSNLLADANEEDENEEDDENDEDEEDEEHVNTHEVDRDSNSVASINTFRTAGTDEMPSNKKTQTHVKAVEPNVSVESVQNANMPTTRFALNFRDIEDSIRSFSGDDSLPVEIWINDFEDMAAAMNWDELQKFIFAKRSLKGIAKIGGSNKFRVYLLGLHFKLVSDATLLPKRSTRKTSALELPDGFVLQDYDLT